ncbi:unnamed protein product [Bursaphelenchus okinawaensis]|uniref:Uncharacterized protein n=1 Tax=Bursaphelenchus okinawaensis TaxID=465554 RepID=A0A811JWI8_9BILA|nr:unnamed protein product [Bursaphelenchus okinawaensis]CAG9085569.1 unnamed protein product [Bursaphelenchus okinawaensis]
MSITQDDVQPQVDDIFSYMCSLAVAKCAKRSEKKKASCGGAAMRKRLLIKNFVAFMLEQEKNMSDKYDEEVTRELRKQLKGKIPSTSVEKKVVDEVEEEEEEEESEEEEVYEDETVEEEENEEEEEESEEEEEDGEEEEYVSMEDPIVQDLNVHSYDDSLTSCQTDLNDSLDSAFLNPTNNNMFMYSECEDLNALPNDLDDCLSDYDPMFNKPMPPTFTSSTPSHGLVPSSSPTSAPSWRDPEPDLYMLEGSRRYYDDFHTVPAREYSILSSEEMSSSHENLMYPVYEQFMISPSCAGTDYSVPQPLPENFMEDGQTSLADSIPSSPPHDLGTETQTYSELLNVSYEKEKKNESTTAFVDLVNVPVAKVASCGMEAYLSESASVYGHCITDLDTNTTTVMDNKYEQSTSRKRSVIYDCFDGTAKRLKL